MRLLKRIAVLMKADAHGIVESLEERSLLLEQYLREAEIELDRNVARLGALRDEAVALSEALAREEEVLGKLDEDVSWLSTAARTSLRASPFAGCCHIAAKPRTWPGKGINARRKSPPSASGWRNSSCVTRSSCHASAPSGIASARERSRRGAIRRRWQMKRSRSS